MILKGDCIEVMKAIKPNSVDAIVCDPPYGLEFMGKEWDKLWDSRRGKETVYSKKRYKSADGCIRKVNPVSRLVNRPNYKAGLEMQLWHTKWLTEAYRVLKPGGSMLVMGGTRTSHRLACAIEDSGFIIKDTLMWLYGSGFPKAQDLGKMIDKRNGKPRKVIELEKYLSRQIKKYYKDHYKLAKEMKVDESLIRHWIGKHRNQPLIPSLRKYKILKEKLKLNDQFDNLIKWEEAKRGKIGEDKTFGDSWFFEKHKFDLTSPSTDLAKHWDGFKVGGIKPAYEPIIWAVKPPEGSYVDNVLKWNVGAVNVDACRISLDFDNELHYNNKYEKPKNQNTLPSMLQGIPNPQKSSIKNKETNVQSPMQEQDDGGGEKLVLERRVLLQHGRIQIHSDEKRLSDGTQVGNGKASGKKAGATGNSPSSQRNESRQQDRESETIRQSRDSCFEESCNDRQQNQKIQKHLGRFPANVILSHHPECVQVGMKKVDSGRCDKPSDCDVKGNTSFDSMRGNRPARGYGLETVESWDCHPDCAVRMLDEQSGVLGTSYRKRGSRGSGTRIFDNKSGGIGAERGEIPYNDNGGASRFFYCAKASRGERNAGLEGMEEKVLECLQGNKDGTLNKRTNHKPTLHQNNHPTVKPIKLFEYLIKLVTREGQIVLDPFMGSGTTAIAAHNVGRKCVGIEKEDEYLTIAKRRIDYWENQPKQMEMGI